MMAHDFFHSGDIVQSKTGGMRSFFGPQMSWGVFDYTTNEEIEFDAIGGHFQSIDGHRYLVVVRVQDVGGVQKITLDGSGRFDSASDPDKNGTSYGAPERLPASIPRQEFTNSGVAPTLQDLIVVMNPDIGAVFDYFKLSCGFHFYNNMVEKREFLAADGLMTFSATSMNSARFTSLASLTTSPEP
jgi:hypothetical protein